MDAVLLAAGQSMRFGKNKLLYRFRGKPMYRHILEGLYHWKTEHLLEHLIVVTQFEEIAADVEVSFPEAELVINPHPEYGISGSVRLGLIRLEEVSPRSEGCLFAVADQPYLTRDSLSGMIRCGQNFPDNIVAASADGLLGNPVLFPRKYFKELAMLSGDRGGKKVLHAHRDQVVLYEIPLGELRDFDTAEAVLADAFPFLAERGHVISIVGAGGKTTLMYVLAQYYALHGKKVIITTTTHVRRPEEYPLACRREELEMFVKANPVVVVGNPAAEGKLTVSTEISIGDCQRAADVVLIEADGAKHLPCKVPAEWEPVIVPECDIVLGVMGMDAPGNILGEICFRKEQAMALLGTGADHVLTEEDLALILSSEQGTRKDVGDRAYYVILNKCDDSDRMKRGQKIRSLLKDPGIRDVVCLSLREFEKRSSENE